MEMSGKMKIKKGYHPMIEALLEFHDLFTPQFDMRNKKDKIAEKSP